MSTGPSRGAGPDSGPVRAGKKPAGTLNNAITGANGGRISSGHGGLWRRIRGALSRTDDADALVSMARGWRPQQVLRPVSPAFIWITLIIGLVLNLLPWGRAPGVPDFVALALVFWNVHQPRRVGMGAAFVFGLMMDVHDGALFGQHALAYTLLSYGAISLHRRILWFPLGGQMVYVAALLLVGQLATLVVRMWVGGAFPGGAYFLESVIGALSWPLVSGILLAPQRRPVDRDQTRPL